MGVVQYSSKTQTSLWFSLRLSSPSQQSIDAYNLPFYISGFVGTICEIKCFLRVTSIVFPPATAKIYIRTYLYFYILAKCKACTQKLFQTLLLHPSMYSIVQNTLNISYLEHSKILRVYTENYEKLLTMKNIFIIFNSLLSICSSSISIFERLLCIGILQFCICPCIAYRNKKCFFCVHH